MFALADCNNFFASCETVFNPKLKNKPLVILSNNDGCIIARSKKAKELGIKMGEPIFHYKGRTDILRLSSNFELYSDMSHRVMQTLATCSFDLEIYSIDEAFFYLDSPDLKKEAHRIREKVRKWTGIPISIGVAPTKTLAKLASKNAKKNDGASVLTENMESSLGSIEVGEIWGIGPALSTRLKKNGIYSVLDLKNASDSWIRKTLGVVGYRTVLELRGKPCFELNEIPEKKKSIVCSSSFGHKVTKLEEVYEAVSTFSARAGKKLREQMSYTSFLSVFLISKNGVASCHATFPNATSYTPDLIKAAKIGAGKLFDSTQIYRKAGVLIGDFTDIIQPDLINPPKQEHKIAMNILDEINALYDQPKIQFASEGFKKCWKSKRNHTTPKFTTRWSDLLKIS